MSERNSLRRILPTQNHPLPQHRQSRMQPLRPRRMTVSADGNTILFAIRPGGSDLMLVENHR